MDDRYLKRLNFEKKDLMAFVGHLDLMLIFQKAIIRAGLPVAYSTGFNPHQKLVIAYPLPLYMEGLSECVDLELTREVPCPEVVAHLNETLPSGLKVTNCYDAPAGKSCGGLVKAAQYEIVSEQPLGDIHCAVNQIMNAEGIPAVTKSKNKTSDIDARPLIFNLTAIPSGVLALLAAGGEKNLKPKVFADILVKTLDLPTDSPFIITRTALFTFKDGEYVRL